MALNSSRENLPAVLSLVEQAIALENNYKELLLQGDEVDQRIQLWQNALEICVSATDVDYAGCKCDLCTLLQIPAHFSCVALPHVHSSAHVAILQHRLAKALRHRYNHFYHPADLEKRIALCREALLFLHQHTDHLSSAQTMACLGSALYMRFSLTAQENDLEEGFELLSSAVHCSDTEPLYLADLGELLLRRYFASGSLEYLNQSHAFLQRAHSLRFGHPTRGRICVLLAAVILDRDQHVGGGGKDLPVDSLIGLYKESLLWQPPGHLGHFEGWDGLGMAFQLRNQIMGNIHDLTRAINCSQIACIMVNPNHPRTFRFSANLAGKLFNRYSFLGNPADYELAIVHARHALDVGPMDRRPLLLRVLATMLITAATHSGNIETLSEAISLAREALDSVQESFSYSILLKLGIALILKASYFGDIEALKEGIWRLQQSLGGVDEGTLNYIEGVTNTSEALLQLYEEDSSQHSHCLREAIQLLESSSPEINRGAYRDGTLHLRAKAYRTRFRHHGLYDDLRLALELDEEALDLRPSGHRLRYLSLSAVSEDLALRYELSTTVEAQNADLERALFMQKEALKEISEGHPDHPRMIISLAKMLLIPHSPYVDYEKAFLLLTQMLQDLQGNVYRCIVDIIPVLNSLEVELVSEGCGDHLSVARKQCLDVYQALINLLPRLASLDMVPARQVHVLAQARNLATRASSHAIRLAQIDRAVAILEAGRAVFWAQLLRLRTPLDSLDGDIARELRDISRRLEVPAASHIPPDLDDNFARARMEKVMKERRELSARFDELVSQVRSQPGMDQFLRNLDYTALSSAAIRGPVVILQASWMCVITAPRADPQIIPLHEVTDEWLKHAAHAFRQSARASRMRFDDRGARKRVVTEMESYVSEQSNILEELWKRVAQPLLAVLGWMKKQGRERPRLFLCPTGMFSFLPIHAAGLYNIGTECSSCLSDYCIASYTPTLRSLLTCQEQSMTVHRTDVKVLVAAAPEPFTSTALLAVREETALVSNIVSNDLLDPSTEVGTLKSVPSYFSKADEVIQHLPDATILHLACHGVQKVDNPLASGFIMQDRMMQVSDLIRLNLPNARLAFLSACETAQGDIERPDEALHLAATMLYAGFKSIVGTMWSMGDVDGPVVAETVYDALFRGDNQVLDFDVVPYALDAAVRKLRAQGLEPNRWAPYIHIGM